MKVQLQPDAIAPTLQPAHPTTLAEAAADAATIKHDWAVSNNGGAPGVPGVEPISLKDAPASRDAAYWQDRVRVVRAKLEESDIAVEAQDRLVKDFRVGGLEWTKAINELNRLMEVRLNDMHHFSETANEARKAGFTPEKYDGPSHKYKDKP